MKNFIQFILYRIQNLIIYPFLGVKNQIFNEKFIDYTRGVPPNAVSQLLLKLKYQELRDLGRNLPKLSEVGFKAFSQTDEDGMLLYIFSIIGNSNKKSVEICSGSGIECNTANLIINHGWSGLLIDGNKERIKEGNTFYRRNSNTYVYPPTFCHAWITKDNVNKILAENGFEGNIDLLSIDMDGVDYWIWNAIDIIEPRVVVVEYQDIIGPNESLTVPYSDDFNGFKHKTDSGFPDYCGASLLAFKKLAEKKGYHLVGCNTLGYNAFFIKNTLGENEIPEISIEDCFKHPKVIWGMNKRFPKVKNLPWVKV